jgi:hypothetical protein
MQIHWFKTVKVTHHHAGWYADAPAEGNTQVCQIATDTMALFMDLAG